ncbi:FAM210A [Cordylochernes scorpioides]|uniref:FAM210A n=1 Tax=Cordylochernes scorpioides TaxID=51811 RepID=A0ABY6KHQ6_9ARAC|nr:FAM210A [Cordylochernes scorpioides]
MELQHRAGDGISVKWPLVYTNHHHLLRTSPHSATQTEQPPPPPVESEPKLSLYQRYKKMLKEYWYVLLPVHIVTSLMWFTTFYYAAKMGVDIVPVLEAIKLDESIIQYFRNSSLGYFAMATGMYKLATPARYMVTLGGTTFTIKYLTRRGLIKPIPSTQTIRTSIKKKMDKLQNTK